MNKPSYEELERLYNEASKGSAEPDMVVIWPRVLAEFSFQGGRFQVWDMVNRLVMVREKTPAMGEQDSEWEVISYPLL